MLAMIMFNSKKNKRLKKEIKRLNKAIKLNSKAFSALIEDYYIADSRADNFSWELEKKCVIIENLESKLKEKGNQ